MLVWPQELTYSPGLSLLVRGIFAALTALLISILIGKPMIKWLQRRQVGQIVRDDGPKSHFDKRGTPTMGGVLIIFAVVVSTLIWAPWHNVFVWMSLLVVVGFGAIGWWDDHLKSVLKHPKGLRSRWKFFWLSVISLVVSWVLFTALKANHADFLLIPFWLHGLIPLSGWLVVLTYLVLVSTSNAVNLTDGLDGLATIPSLLVICAFTVYAFVESSQLWSNWFQLPYIPHAAAMVIFGASLIGACIGFLWFNAYPAQVFMGDVGALALGGAIGVMATVVRQEILLIIMGGLFVVEVLSVILQVGSYKLFGRRVFKMAPIHHHFELSGWPEPKVVIRFSIITLFLVCIGLFNLFLR